MTIAREQDGVERVNGMMTVHLSPDEIVLALSLEFADPLNTPGIEQRVAALEQTLRVGAPANHHRVHQAAIARAIPAVQPITASEGAL